MTCALSASSASAAPLKTLVVGLGQGTITSSPAGINCGSDCDQSFGGTTTVTLTATAATGSTFDGWLGDCSGSTTCTFDTSVVRSVRAKFRLNTAIPKIVDFTPEKLDEYLLNNPVVNSAARFLAALPDQFSQNWIPMSRSESLQTGTAEFPRFITTSGNAQQVFTFGLATHSAYPGSHPDAIEYMQWDAAQKNFRFHEVVLATVPGVPGATQNPLPLLKERLRGVSRDDIKCSRCHSTRNVETRLGGVGTTGIPPGFVKAKGKPNWDAYDSWGGMLPFNRDRIYQGSVEAAALRKLLNPWTWRNNAPVRAFIEQLQLQPPGVPAVDQITRLDTGGADDGQIKFAFDGTGTVLSETAPVGDAPDASTAYAFDGGVAPPATTVVRGGAKVLLRHTSQVSGLEEGRGVQLFDLLGGLDGQPNAIRVADEIASHRFATGSVPFDVRPIAMAVAKQCFKIVGQHVESQGTAVALSDHAAFFDARHDGKTVDLLLDDTRVRTEALPRRKADIQRQNLDRTSDIYWPGGGPGLIQQYGAATSFGVDASLLRLRQEVFRRPIDLGAGDKLMGGMLVDREQYGANTLPITFYRYFLEPLGVSVDKWSMGVRGRSRAYAFADVFGGYTSTFINELSASLMADPFPELSPGDVEDCTALMLAVNRSLEALPPADAIPKYTDIQRIFNKGCIECHGGLEYPPVTPPFDVRFFDLSEDDFASGSRLRRSYDRIYDSTYTTNDPDSSRLFQRLLNTNESCPFGGMPCGGPQLSQSDIATFRRWIVGKRPYSEGDPHVVTVDGVHYDFQGAGEFVLLKDELLELQVRQVPVETEGPLSPNEHTGLASCASINGAVAVKVGPHRITYQPDPLGGLLDFGLLDEFGLDDLGILDMGLDALRALLNLSGPRLRVDGRAVLLTSAGVNLPSGGRILPTDVPGGIQIQAPGGTDIVLTPGYWTYYQLWYLNIDVRHTRASDGVMGSIAPKNWLPALPSGAVLGPRPVDFHQRYVDLYQTFANAWRVSPTTSLFDYGPGTSTNTYTVPSWPPENAYTCRLPQGTPGKPNKPPAARLPIATAREYCKTVEDPGRRTNCEQDVAVTGNPGFANTYLATERIEQNVPPAPPPLGSPAEDSVGLPTGVTFTWTKVSDPEGEKLTYSFCVWPADQRFNHKYCKQVGKLSHHWDKLTPTSTTAFLDRKTAYYWKVIVQDESGAVTESVTRRFATR